MAFTSDAALIKLGRVPTISMTFMLGVLAGCGAPTRERSTTPIAQLSDPSQIAPARLPAPWRKSADEDRHRTAALPDPSPEPTHLLAPLANRLHDLRSHHGLAPRKQLWGSPLPYTQIV